MKPHRLRATLDKTVLFLLLSLVPTAALTATTERVSVDSSGIQGNGGSRMLSISADGRYVAFDSSATNLVPGDTNGVGDVFVHDSPSVTSAIAPVYRFWSDVYGAHFYTISEQEKNHVIATWPDIWRFEGAVYYAYTYQAPGTSPIYRFWSDLYGAHFYTISEEEKDHVIATWPDIWRFEGPAFYAYTYQTPGTSPIYRFWSDLYGAHFYTISEEEKDHVIATWPDTWRFEGPVFYAYPSPFEYTTRSGPVTSNETWRGIIDITGDVTIYDPAVVTIEPGTIVRFAANSDDRAEGGTSVPRDPCCFPHDPATPASQISGLAVYGGTLLAVGTADNPIVFTSSASNPIRGDWGSIRYDKEGSRLILQNTIIEYGYWGVQIDQAANDSNITIQDNTIRHIVACGVCTVFTEAAYQVTLTLAKNDISDCGNEAIDSHSNATLLIANNVLHDNLWSFGDGRSGTGVIIDGNNSIIRNNKFIANRCAISFLTENSNPTVSGNTFVDNDSMCCGDCPASLTIYENTTRAGGVVSNETWRGTIDITGDVVIGDHGVVTIDPGTIVRFAAGSDNQADGAITPITDPYFPHDPPMDQSQMSSLSVYGGTLVAVGSVDKPIVFTSSGSNPTRGDWDVIAYDKEGSKLILESTIIEYAYRGVAINNSADNSNVTLRNNTIRHIVTCGICAGSGPSVQQAFDISNNDISDCGHEAIAGGDDNFLVIENNVLHDNLWSFGDGPAGAGVALSGSNATIRNNQFLRNRCGISINGRPLISGNVFLGNDNNCCGDCPVPLQ